MDGSAFYDDNARGLRVTQSQNLSTPRQRNGSTELQVRPTKKQRNTMGRSGNLHTKFGMPYTSEEQAEERTRRTSNMVSPDNNTTTADVDGDDILYAQALEYSKKEEEDRIAKEAACKKKEDEDMEKAIQASLCLLSGGQLP